ncbi:MAG TPA: DUF4380 domain-containing protein [Tepidisphaeraceae bacterium]|nr:DUF4380 domain-containing protein [Tepidisphaeraceae bacterium]
MTVEKVDYQKWHDAYRLKNDSCEMVIVPQVGRVMFFARTGGQNVLYNNEDLSGQTVPGDDHQWHNFGGDKVWPTQQDWWDRYTDRKGGWPPPYFSDAAPQSAEPIPHGVRMTSPLSPEFGTRTIREFVMDPKLPMIHVRQWFKKEGGKPVVMTLWTVTQVRQPEYAMAPLGEPIDGKPFKNLADTPPNAKGVGQAVLIRNDPKKPQKIGTAPSARSEGTWVAGIFEKELFVESRRTPVREGYPDQNCSAEIFTADEPLKMYVELELLSPMREIKAGDTLEADCVWQIAEITPEMASDPAKAAKLAQELCARAQSLPENQR